ncbi:MAG TPA: DUF6801 domain-containing protein [Pseudonocardiaceae bacterium]|nr:DUF6801 domain-containing protein [Pseudonocardiaceae bacterium]
MLRGAAALMVAGAVAGVVMLAEAGPASAASLSLNWTCPFPPLADQTLATNISVNLPASIPVNTQTGAINVSVAATVPATATQGLDLVGGASLSGTASAAATLNEPGGQKLNITIPMTIPNTPIPQNGTAFTTNASGAAPSIQFATAGQGSIVVGNSFSMVLHIKNSSGGATSLPEPYNTNCTANSGQNMQLSTFTVTGGGGGGTTTTTSSTGTTTTGTSSTGTTTTGTTTTGTSTTGTSTTPTTGTTESTTTAESPTSTTPVATTSVAPVSTTSTAYGYVNTGGSSGSGSSGTGSLAYTGVSVLGPVIAGLVLIIGGGTALLFARRRRAAGNSR